MEQKKFFHVYSSKAVKIFKADELTALLKKSQTNNAKVGLTGLLIHKDGQFMQLIEGPEEAVRATLKKIAVDPRHKDMVTLLEGTSDERQFSEWSMGFRDLDSPEVRSLPGFSDFLNTSLDGTEFKTSPTRAQRLLLMLKKS
ncbi:MAG: BLUF domain-containing protein [Bdellovibrionota bacterium]